MILNAQYDPADGSFHDFLSATSTTTSAVVFQLAGTPTWYRVYCTAFTYPSSGYDRVIVSCHDDDSLLAVTNAGRLYVTSSAVTHSFNSSTNQLTITRKSSSNGNFNSSLTYKLEYFYC